MSLSVGDVCEALDRVNLKYGLADHETIDTGFGGLDNYRNVEGSPSIRVMMGMGDGRLKMVAPRAWIVPQNERRSAVFETCLRMQWKYFAIRLEFDHRDGELRPCFDFHPGALPAAPAVPMMLKAFVKIIDAMHPHLDAVINTGVMLEDEPGVGDILEAMGSLSPEQVRALLIAIRSAETA